MRKIKAGGSKVGKRYTHSIRAMGASSGGSTSDVMKMRKRGGFNTPGMSTRKRVIKKMGEVHRAASRRKSSSMLKSGAIQRAYVREILR